MRWLLALLLSGLAVLAWAVMAGEAPHITVENRTGLRIVQLELLVEEQRATLDPLDGFDLVRQMVPLRVEGPTRLRVQFEGEPMRTLRGGWFAPGQTGGAAFVLVAPDSVVFEVR